MKMKTLPLFYCLLWAIMIQAQIKIGDAPQTILPGSLLELQSNDKTLVITRVNTAQMDLITASEGALVYNTDIGCVHYYNGTEWVNICDAVAGSVSFTSRDSTIHIAATGNNYDLTVGMIDGEKNIDEYTIHSDHLMNGSISKIKLGLYAVGNAQIDDEVVGPGLTRTKVGPPGDEIVGPLTVNLGEGLVLNDDTEAIDVDITALLVTGDITSEDINITGGENAALTDVTLAIAEGAVTEVKLANGAVTPDKIANGAVTDVKLNKSAIPLSGFGAAA